MNVQSPETLLRFGLRRDVYPPLQVLQTNGRLCHLALASHLPEELQTAGSRALHGRYSASTLLPTPPPPSRLSTDFPAWPVIRSTLLLPLSWRDEEGFSSCYDVSLSPCCRYHPAGVTHRIGQSSLSHAAFTYLTKVRPPGHVTFGATSAFTYVTAR